MEDLLAHIKRVSEELSRPMLIAGPCSAESEKQVMQCAEEILKRQELDYFRAGVWKPRTRPNSFEGHGAIALPWLKKVKETYDLKLAVEVATPEHAKMALDNGVDLLWIGARTTANPFSIQLLADYLGTQNVPVMIKNPIHSDLSLWIGALERFAQAGVQQLGAIHRGFSIFKKSIYRNDPQWEIMIELKRRYPHLQLICDPSHIAGKRELIEEVSQEALNMGAEGLMIECHPTPDEALSDAQQQITPKDLHRLLLRLSFGENHQASSNSLKALHQLRQQIDAEDEAILKLLAQRMELIKEVGEIKRAEGIPPLDVERWNDLLNKRLLMAQSLGLDPDLISKLYQLIHTESIKIQS